MRRSLGGDEDQGAEVSTAVLDRGRGNMILTANVAIEHRPLTSWY